MQDHRRFPHDRQDRGKEHSGAHDQPSTVQLLSGPNVDDPISGFAIPPDNGLGVSADFIVSAENAVIQWTDLTGNERFEESLTDFWKPLGDFSFPFDVRAQFDPVSGRFLVSDAARDPSGNFQFLVAVSNDANPNDGWSFQSFTPPNPADSIDQPALSTDGQNVYLAATLASGQEAFVIPDGISGTGSPIAIPLDGGGIYKEAAQPGNGNLLFAQDGGLLTIKHIDPAATIDAMSTISLGAVSSVGELEFNLPTLGTVTPVDAGDQRIYGSAYSNGFLYITFEVLPPTGPDAGMPTAHWAQLDVRDPAHAALVAQGDVSGSQIGAGIGTFDSSIAVDGNGDVLINFAASGTSIVPTDYYVVHQAGTAAGTFSAPTEYMTSAGPFVDPSASPFGGTSFPVSRFGDYSSAVSDPQNPNSFWISGEYGTTPNSWQWGTSIAHVIVGPTEDHIASKHPHEDTISPHHGLHDPKIRFMSASDQRHDIARAHALDGQDASISMETSGGDVRPGVLDLGSSHHGDWYDTTIPARSTSSGTNFQLEHRMILANPDTITQA